MGQYMGCGGERGAFESCLLALCGVERGRLVDIRGPGLVERGGTTRLRLNHPTVIDDRGNVDVKLFERGVMGQSYEG